tara:strand:+ start:1279 stop:1917 length:639 start_codon:yes stop_codon:yes gene_type:complete
MLLTNDWCLFDEVLSKKTCNRIIELGNKGFETASIEKNDAEITAEERIKGKKYEQGVNKKERECDIAWVKDQWIYQLIWPYMEEANEHANWKFDIKAVEAIQLTRYKKGGFCGFHGDGRSDHLSAYNLPKNEFFHGKVRKLSMSILLNDDYEGGAFQFAQLVDRGESVTPTPGLYKAGSIIVFPSFMIHRVQPVTKGTRYSLVSWFLGPPFK